MVSGHGRSERGTEGGRAGRGGTGTETEPRRGPLRVVVAPDSFKGSATAREVADAVAAGLGDAFAGVRPAPLVRTLPLADGGEGTLDAMRDAWGIEVGRVATTDAIGRPTTARFGVSPDGRVGVIEAADANGLPAVADVALRPLTATSRGVGAIVRAVLEAGVAEIIVCIGGSASTDGGAGLLQSLGARLTDAAGRELPPGGGALRALHAIDLSGLDPRARAVSWRIACDVDNPLLGPAGSAAVYGPQKGADAADIRELEAGLARLADVLAVVTGTDVRGHAGIGAAGGLALPLVALFDARLEPGASLVAAALGAPALLTNAEVVITGEGRLDAQSFSGKVVGGVRQLTPPDVPVIVIAGEVALAPTQLVAAGITAAFSLAPGPATRDELRRDVAPAARRTAFSVGRLIAAMASTRDAP
jgi:glycerate kinase